MMYARNARDVRLKDAGDDKVVQDRTSSMVRRWQNVNCRQEVKVGSVDWRSFLLNGEGLIIMKVRDARLPATTICEVYSILVASCGLLAKVLPDSYRVNSTS